MNEVYLGLGSNLHDRKTYLCAAIKLLHEDHNVIVKAISSTYETSPISDVPQSDFLNLVIKVSVNYDAESLLKKINLIEKTLNRKRLIHWGPRTIDIDILYFNDETLMTKNLCIPHKEIKNRLFVQIPLLEICPSDFYQRTYLQERMDTLNNSSQKIKRIEDSVMDNIFTNTTNTIEDSVKNIIRQTGDNPEREGLIETPKRVAKMYNEILSSQVQQNFENYKVFNTEPTNNSQMVLINDIPFYSMCEHHMLPFFGTVHVAYIPKNGKIIGLSKIPRLVDFVSKRLNVQENITKDTATILEEILNPKGVAVVVDARHMCVEMRGIKKGNCVTRTSFYSGVFDNNSEKRYEFLQTLNNK